MESPFSKKAKESIYSSSIPLVVKADGLASGKVCYPWFKRWMFQISELIFNGKFGNSGI